MARKAAEEAWGRQFAYLVAAEPEKKAHCQAFFDNALQAAGAKHLTLNTADPGVLVERLEQRAKAQASKGAGGQQEQGFDVTTGQELLREAAWLAAGQHGFAALAGIPELQQIISHACLPALQHYGCLLDDWQHSEAEFEQRQKTELDQTQGPLLHHLCPQLRLCLLAEVAAGLLVPGHPLPPDTIEHAAALYAFIDEASTKLAHEIFCQPQFYNGCSSRSGGCYSSGDQRKLDKAVTGLLVAKPLNPAGGSKSDLAPHVDLQLAPPPQLLLELLLLQLEGDPQQQQQFQQRYRLDSEQMGGLGFLMAADESFAWMHQIAQQVQQQQQHACSQQGSPVRCSSSSCNQADASAPAAAAAAGVWQLLGQVHQQGQQHPRTAALLQQLPPATDAASLAANLVQLLAEGSIGQECGSSALNQSTCRQVVQQLRLLGGALVLRFVAAARAAGGPAWQGEVPLQAVVLLGALEQLQGLALAYLHRSDVVRAAANASSSSSSQCMSKANGHHSRAPAPAGSVHCCSNTPPLQQSPAADRISCDESDSEVEDGTGTSTAGPAAQEPHSSSTSLLRVLHKVQELLTLLRRFKEANAALNAAAAADPSGAAVAAPASLTATYGRGLSAPELFSAASPLLHQYPQPCGHGIWAPTVAPAAAAEEAAGAPVQAPCSSTTEGSLPAANAGSSSSSGGSRRGSLSAADAGSSSSSSSEPDWLHCESLAALAGAGVLSQRAHSWLTNLQGGEGGKSLHEQLADAAPKLLQQMRGGSTPMQNSPQLQQQQQQQGLTGKLQALHRVCLQHGLILPPEALEQLALARRLVLDLALRHCKQEAAEAGVDSQQSSNLLHSCGKQGYHQRAAAVKKGMTALWNLIRKMSLEVGGPLETHLKASNSQQMHQAFSSLSLGAALGAAGSSSSSSDGAAVDDGSFRASCKLCQLEKQQQQQQQQHASAGSSSSSSAAEQPGDAADPFMWRRLMWRLVGRIKPTARRLFAADGGICPHSDNTYMWHELTSSLKLHLWVAPGDEAGLGRLLLVRPTLEAHLLAQPRSFFVKHFARAANLAFAQGYGSPAPPLLSHQVLLALSPLHRQQLPQPELAPLLPSSFGPAVARVLSQQLGLGGCLREFEHEAAGQPAMWHVWWHIGLRRYHWQQQQQQGDRLAAGTSSSSSGLSRLSPDQLEALYSDPAAKYYAVGFASRQLCPDVTWQAPAALGSSSSSSSRQLSTMQGLASQLLAACRLTYTHILHRHSSLAASTSPNSQASSSSGGYQWPVMQLLQQGAGSCQASQVPLDEPGPFGLNCCGLLHSRHPHEMSLVGSPHRVLHAHKQADRLSGEYMSGKAMMLAAIAMHRTGMHEDIQRRGLPPFFESFDLL